MGFRAIRWCLENKEIFKDQLRAILMASAHGKVRLMYPMISGVDELTRANALLAESPQG
jgi:phosphotransferase system enzyme I (PtsI)